MTEELSEIPDFVGFMLEYGVEMLYEWFDEIFLENILDLAETLGQQPKILLIDTFHHAALHYHIAELILMTFGNAHLYYFVSTLLKVNRRL